MEYVIERSTDTKKAAKLLAISLGKSVLNKEIKIEYEDSGKPYINDSTYGISISHSKDVILVAIHDNLIGADIENIRTFDDRLIKTYFTPEEAQFATDTEKFFTVWTIKEAYLKLTGEGLKGIKKLNVINSGKIYIEGYNILTKVCEDYVFSIVYK